MSDIYAHHVLNGNGSFEETPPSVDVMQKRWQHRERDAYPTLVARLEGQVAGFAYASNYKSRSAYRYTVEDSIYVAADALGKGVGQALLDELIRVCTAKQFRQMIAVIGDSDNQASIALHERCGFILIGVAKELGFKNNRWLDIVYMQRQLAPVSN